jgi:hypothetical protein
LGTKKPVTKSPVNLFNKVKRGLALTCFETLVHFVDDVDTTATANDLIVAMPGAQRFDGIFDFHSGHPLHSKKLAPAGAENSLRFLYGLFCCLSTFSTQIHAQINLIHQIKVPLAAVFATSGMKLSSPRGRQSGHVLQQNAPS